MQDQAKNVLHKIIKLPVIVTMVSFLYNGSN